MSLRNGNRSLARVGVAFLLSTVATVSAVAPTSAAPDESDYIVVLSETDGVQHRATAVAERFGGDIEHVYTAALNGFTLALSPAEAKELAGEPGVAMVVPDAPVRAMGEQVNPPSWGLDRIDERRPPLDGIYEYPNDAETVHAYVLDTGVSPHPDFGTRLLPGIDIVNGDNDAADGNGHGTFVAGIIGGTQYGVAKKIKIVPVKVLSDFGSGTIAGVIAGIDWVTANAVKPAVANMSLGGGANAALDAAVRNSIDSGVPYTVPAGSSASDVANFSPARVAEALTVGASTQSDCAAPQSNHGPGLDLYAPGQNITGPWPGGGTMTMSGSSLAAPHTAGVVGMYLHEKPNASAAKASAAVVAAATWSELCGVPPNTANRLLFAEA